MGQNVFVDICVYEVYLQNLQVKVQMHYANKCYTWMFPKIWVPPITPIFANTYLNKSQQIQSECLPHKPHNLQNDFSSSIV